MGGRLDAEGHVEADQPELHAQVLPVAGHQLPAIDGTLPVQRRRQYAGEGPQAEDLRCIDDVYKQVRPAGAWIVRVEVDAADGVGKALVRSVVDAVFYKAAVPLESCQVHFHALSRRQVGDGAQIQMGRRGGLLGGSRVSWERRSPGNRQQRCLAGGEDWVVYVFLLIGCGVG